MSQVQQASPTYDLVVVGAGINGTGIARDASRRGLTVLLLDKTDIAAGTTSWSSRLIHGGLRYLEYGEAGLVHESLQERERLLRIAPHLVFPLPLTLPIYAYHKRGPLLIRAGMVAYDTLSWNKTLPKHRMFDREGALAHVPGLNPDGLKAAARYYDAQIEFPERMSVENTVDAVDHGAVVETQALVDGLILEAGVVRGVRWLDASGQRREARTRTVVNVAGPWVDRFLDAAGIAGTGAPLLGVTKGTHIVVEPFRGAPTDALYIEAKSDGRPYFIIPWNGLYLIGTTDHRYIGDLDRVVPTEEEIAYLLQETVTAIPGSGLVRESVLYAYAGLRPLPNQAGAESGVTRRHIIHNHAPRVAGLLSIIGGKLTTFRNLAERVVDTVGELQDRTLPASVTAGEPLPGGTERPGPVLRSIQQDRLEWLSSQSAGYLVRIYGSRARDVIAFAAGQPSMREVVHGGTGAIAAAVAHALEHEHAVSLTDIIMRRTMIGYAADAGTSAVDAVARIAGTVAGWDAARTAAEIAAHRGYMERFLPRDSRVGEEVEV
ncbi:MAG TPA: glycerol-3-phosphate dehydrogenase/oxidase [Thermomicrobiales bacterium]|nr:glycerol-3-phosphate dehydrogenase/oxidase [Thermomicrobiales bacterium]